MGAVISTEKSHHLKATGRRFDNAYWFIRRTQMDPAHLPSQPHFCYTDRTGRCTRWLLIMKVCLYVIQQFTSILGVCLYVHVVLNWPCVKTLDLLHMSWFACKVVAWYNTAFVMVCMHGWFNIDCCSRCCTSQLSRNYFMRKWSLFSINSDKGSCWQLLSIIFH